ncbi:glycine-rich domain-containing protein [Actinacidiphila glaucinigra]|uniref:glycine-rich domain-containing protein n=1 Tax=Actinacidiphila glaucinigra TaxID=235986 RepID=UPI003715852F
MDFNENGTFTAPADVTRVFVQVWGAGGGGGGVSTTLPIILGGGGGAGGFAWCAVPVTPGTDYTVTVGLGGIGSSTFNTNGTNGADTTLSGPGGPLAGAGGGAGGHFGSLTPTPSAGGTGNCYGNSGTTRTGAAGQPPLSAGLVGQGGRPPVNGIVEPEPQGAGTGGDGALIVLQPAQNGGNGYAVIWW